MADDRTNGYARGIFEMASGEGSLDRVESELLTISRAFETSPELRSNLTDPQLPIEKKQAIVDELLGGRASSLTVGVVQLLVGQNRASELPAIASAVAGAAAASRDKAVAEVRSAVPLDEGIVQRLTSALVGPPAKISKSRSSSTRRSSVASSPGWVTLSSTARSPRASTRSARP